MSGRVAGFRLYKWALHDGNFYAALFRPGGSHLMAAYAFQSDQTISDKWFQTWVRPWVRVEKDVDYLFGVLFVGGHYFRTNGIITIGPGNPHGHIAITYGWQSTAAFPFISSPTANSNANAIDVLFQPD